MSKYGYFIQLSIYMPSPCFTWCAEWLVFLVTAGNSGAGVQSWVLTLQCMHWPGLLLIHFDSCTWLLLLLLILYTLTLILCVLRIKKCLNFLSIGCCNNETAVAGVCSMHIYILHLVYNVITTGHTYTICGYFKPLSMGFFYPSNNIPPLHTFLSHYVGKNCFLLITLVSIFIKFSVVPLEHQCIFL
jgi:hypothetical protein